MQTLTYLQIQTPTGKPQLRRWDWLRLDQQDALTAHFAVIAGEEGATVTLEQQALLDQMGTVAYVASPDTEGVFVTEEPDRGIVRRGCCEYTGEERPMRRILMNRKPPDPGGGHKPPKPKNMVH